MLIEYDARLYSNYRSPTLRAPNTSLIIRFLQEADLAPYQAQRFGLPPIYSNLPPHLAILRPEHIIFAEYEIVTPLHLLDVATAPPSAFQLRVRMTETIPKIIGSNTLGMPTICAQRLRQVIEYTKMAPAVFAKWIGVSQPVLSMILNGRSKRISSEVGEKITECIWEIDPEWLLWGRNQMFRKDIEFKPHTDHVTAASSAPYAWREEIEHRIDDLEHWRATTKEDNQDSGD